MHITYAGMLAGDEQGCPISCATPDEPVNATRGPRLNLLERRQRRQSWRSESSSGMRGAARHSFDSQGGQRQRCTALIGHFLYSVAMRQVSNGVGIRLCVRKLCLLAADASSGLSAIPQVHPVFRRSYRPECASCRAVKVAARCVRCVVPDL